MQALSAVPVVVRKRFVVMLPNLKTDVSISLAGPKPRAFEKRRGHALPRTAELDKDLSPKTPLLHKTWAGLNP